MNRTSRNVGCVAATAAALFVLTGTSVAQDEQPARSDGDRPAFEIELANSRKLKFSGELRWRAEKRENYDFNDDAGSNPFFVGQRARLGFDFTVNDKVRAFVQLADVRQFGEETSTTDRSADGQDLHQGFIEWQACDDWLLKIGRQEVALGEQRLVSSLNWLDQGRSLDGVVASYKTGNDHSLHGFATIINNDNLLTDNRGAWINGLYWTRSTGDLEYDLYTILLLNEETPQNGTENRWTLGTRVRHEPESGFFAGLEAATQTGEVNNADIPFGETFALHADCGFQFVDQDLRPRFMLEFNMASGNDPNSSDNERFNNLIPFAHAYFGQMDFALWENILHVAAHAHLHPAEGSKLKFAWHYFQSIEEGDRFGGPVNTLSTGVVNGDDEMGHEIDVSYRHPLGNGIWGEAGLSYFLAGDGVRDARGTDDNAMFAYYMMGIRI